MLAFVAGAVAAEKPDPARWEDDIAAFEAHDQSAGRPKPGGVLFVGSSSIRLWDTKKWFPEWDVINRGFGGSWIQDTLHYAERIIKPYAPKVVVMYAGDNDFGGGSTPDEVYEDYERFAAWLHRQFPDTQLLYIAIKPSLSRWNFWPKMKEANERIQQRCASQSHETFADIAPVTLGADGEPQASLFQEDGLHLNESGYEAWTKVLAPLIRTAMK